MARIDHWRDVYRNRARLDGAVVFRSGLMRRLGNTLLYAGLGLGVLTGAALAWPWDLTGLAWLIGVGAAKLAFAGSAGLLATGAVVLRLDRHNRLGGESVSACRRNFDEQVP